MKAITLYPEWAWAICHLDKRVENRGRRIPPAMVGPLVGLHAGKHVGGRKGHPAHTEGIGWLRDTASRAGWTLGRPGDEWRSFSRQETKIDMCELPIRLSSIVAFVRFGRSTPPFEGNLMGWRVPDQHGWPIVEVLRLKEAVPVERGALGFWELPPAILRRCQEVGTVEDEQLPLFGGV